MNHDGYLNAMLGRFGKIAHQQEYTLHEQTAHQLYSKGGLYARVIDKPADDAMASGFEIENDDGIIQNELDRLKVSHLFADALRWTRLYGGACMVLLTSDNRDLSEPIKKGATITEIKVFDITQIHQVQSFYSSFFSKKFKEPELYQINRSDGGFFSVHESRILTFSGNPLPSHTKTKYLHWQGRDETQCFHSINQYHTAIQYVLKLLERKQQPIYKMTGLGQAIANGFEDEMKTRVEMVDIVRSMMNTVAIDGEDDFNILDLSVGGTKEAITILQEQLSAETGFPLSILFGTSATGLNATGIGDARNYYDMVSALQTKTAQPALERLITLITEQNHLAGKTSNFWRIKWLPLLKPTAKEQLEMDKLSADTAKVYADALIVIGQSGALSAEEIRQFAQKQGLFGLIDKQNTDPDIDDDDDDDNWE